MKHIPFICIFALLTACGNKEHVTVIECESVVTKQDGKYHLRLKPVSTLKGKIESDMLDEDGFLDYVEEFELDVELPESYEVTLVKTIEREGIYRNAPISLIYNIKIEANW